MPTVASIESTAAAAFGPAPSRSGGLTMMHEASEAIEPAAIAARRPGCVDTTAHTVAAMTEARIAPTRWLATLLIQVGQSTPMPLLLFFGYIVAGGLTVYSPLVALVTAMIVLGFYNGGYVAHALHDARASLAPDAPRRAATAIAWTQIVAFLINATKGVPAADMIGVPEFLGVITDLTAHARDRSVLYSILLVFYTLLVLLAIRALTTIERRFVSHWHRPS